MRRFLVTCAALVMGVTSTGMAAEHEVQMLTKGPEGQRNWFEPAIVNAASGDTVNFVATDKTHNSTSLVVPEGAEAWKGQMNKDVSVTVAKPGVYAYKCTPHLALGMLGFIVVDGVIDNIEAVEAAPYRGPKAKENSAALIAEIKASN